MTIFPRLNHALVAVGAILFLLPFSATFAASHAQQPQTTSPSASQRSIGHGYTSAITCLRSCWECQNPELGSQIIAMMEATKPWHG
jgi:hypothetical protein